jgi:hypothetical protein
MQAKEYAAGPVASCENSLGDLKNPFFEIILLAQSMRYKLS